MAKNDEKVVLEKMLLSVTQTTAGLEKTLRKHYEQMTKVLAQLNERNKALAKHTATLKSGPSPKESREDARKESGRRIRR